MRLCPNTSPLLVLARLDRLDLLGAPESVVLTRAVLDEARDRVDAATECVNVLAIQALTVDPVLPDHVDVSHSLGPGERSVIAWALSATGTAVCVLDDAAARREARRLGLTVTGTLGVILRAKRDGRIAAAAPFVEQAVAAGLYLDDAVLRDALGRIGEAWRPPGGGGP